MPNFKQMPMTPAQVLMFPVSVEESVPRDCDVRILGEAMDLLDWSAFEAGYSETGCPAYPPKVLAKILVYGYSKGIRSSRALEDAVKNDKRYIWLAGGLEPDHTTIARFRKQKQAELKAAYKGSVRICAEAGLTLLNVAATDGTRMKARASKRSLYDAKRIAKEMEAIDRILAEAEEVDRVEDELYGTGTGNEVPEELADAKKRKEKLKEIAKRLKEAGCNKVSSTDEECRVMKTGDGLRPAYNVQLTVDSENQVIVAADVVNAQADNGQLIGQIEQVVENTGMKPDVVLADSGYSDQETLGSLSTMDQEAIIPLKEQPQEKKRNDLFASKCFVKDEERDVLICPAGRELPFYREVSCSSGNYREYRAFECKSCSFYHECVRVKGKTGRAIQISVVAAERQRMLEKLSTPEGKELYLLRQQTVEPVFGNVKWNMGFSRFRLNGAEGAKSETWIACIAHNLKIYADRKQRSPVSALSRALCWFVSVIGGVAGSKAWNQILLPAGVQVCQRVLQQPASPRTP
jgi:transposase